MQKTAGSVVGLKDLKERAITQLVTFETKNGDLLNSILKKVEYDNIPVGKFTLSQYETSRTMWE